MASTMAALHLLSSDALADSTALTVSWKTEDQTCPLKNVDDKNHVAMVVVTDENTSLKVPEIQIQM